MPNGGGGTIQGGCYHGNDLEDLDALVRYILELLARGVVNQEDVPTRVRSRIGQFQQAEQARLEQEDRRATAARDRVNALAKLTPAERRALHISSE